MSYFVRHHLRPEEQQKQTINLRVPHRKRNRKLLGRDVTIEANHPRMHSELTIILPYT